MKFSGGEDFQIRRFYATEPRDKVMERLPGRTWGSIQSRAHALKIKRTIVTGGVRSIAEKASPLHDDLIKARLNAGLTQKDLAKRIGISSQYNLSRIETGGSCSLFMLRCWCEALGLELRAVPKETPKKKSRPAFLNKQTIMNVGGVDIKLAWNEALVLNALQEKFPRVVTRETIMNELYGNRSSGETPVIKIVDIYICKIRKRIAGTPYTIDTCQGEGYRLIKRAA